MDAQQEEDEANSVKQKKFCCLHFVHLCILVHLTGRFYQISSNQFNFYFVNTQARVHMTVSMCCILDTLSKGF